MPTTRSRAELLAMIETYEAALTRIAGKHAEWIAVVPVLHPPRLVDALGHLRQVREHRARRAGEASRCHRRQRGQEAR